MDLITAVDGSAPEFAGATDLLRRDHERVRELFGQYRARMDEAPETCRPLAEAICMQWELHARIEREMLYPALEPGGEPAKEGVRTLEDIDECIAILKRWPPGSERDSTMLRMMQLAECHMAREEAGAFPRAERELGGRLEAIGRAMMRRREELAGSTTEVQGRS